MIPTMRMRMKMKNSTVSLDYSLRKHDFALTHYLDAEFQVLMEEEDDDEDYVDDDNNDEVEEEDDDEDEEGDEGDQADAAMRILSLFRGLYRHRLSPLIYPLTLNSWCSKRASHSCSAHGSPPQPRSRPDSHHPR